MKLDSLKTFNEIKLTRKNCQHKLRFTAGNIKMEANGIIRDSKQLAKASLLKIGVGYLASMLQMRVFRYFRK